MVQDLAAAGFPVAVACRTLGLSRSGYYAWVERPELDHAKSDRDLLRQVKEIHAHSRGTYGAPRVQAELRLGRGIRVSRKRIARLMREERLEGSYRRRFRRAKPSTATHDDHVKRVFRVDAPDRLWVTDITQHPTREGWVYAAVVIDVYSRRVVGLSIADHLKTELVIDALEVARWRRRPEPGSTIVHSDRGTQYTSWAFGHRLRQAGLLGSMGRVGSAYDNALCESFFATLQRELLDTRSWTTREELGQAIFEYIEAWYNPHRRHSRLGYESPVSYEQTGRAAALPA